MFAQLTELLSRAPRPRILVVGDVMLDRYLWCDVDRISPEAPIPVLKVARQEHRLGGAGSVTAMLAALGAKVRLASVVGGDRDGQIVRDLLEGIGVDGRTLLVAEDRETTVKERLLGRTHSRHPQQVVRVDREQSKPVAERLAGQLIELIRGQMEGVSLILVSDYAKGICTGRFISYLVELATEGGVPVVADPAIGVDYSRYRGCACVTPNRSEAAAALDTAITTPDEGLEAARRMLRFGVESAMVTLDRDGMAWADVHGGGGLFPVIHRREVYDITGAGDMVLSALGYCLAAGADWRIAVELANLAGGLEVERLGVVPVTRRELLAALSQEGHSTGQKILDMGQLQAELRRRRDLGQQVVMTNGCFDLLHPGHVASLQAARNQGDLLVVGLNSDHSVGKIKGPGHPIVDQRGRAEMLAALACVDYVVLFDEASVTTLVEQILPDVLVKSDQYATEEVVGHEIVEQNGGRVVCVPMRESYSTSALMEKIRSSN